MYESATGCATAAFFAAVETLGDAATATYEACDAYEEATLPGGVGQAVTALVAAWATVDAAELATTGNGDRVRLARELKLARANLVEGEDTVSERAFLLPDGYWNRFQASRKKLLQVLGHIDGLVEALSPSVAPAVRVAA